MSKTWREKVHASTEVNGVRLKVADIITTVKKCMLAQLEKSFSELIS